MLRTFYNEEINAEMVVVVKRAELGATMSTTMYVDTQENVAKGCRKTVKIHNKRKP